nr:Chain C, Marker peptide [Homo sapiens]5C0A_H Chain H, Marker peptide [Homo sapiens]5N1Y_C Chain C, MVWGPDPLYV [Homo sapiens]
MVWGPDPLYV